MTPIEHLEKLIAEYQRVYGLSHPKARQAIRRDLRDIFNQRYRDGRRPA